MSSQSKLGVLASRQTPAIRPTKIGRAASHVTWIPLGLTLYLFTPDREVNVQIVDGDRTNYYGFPLLDQSDALFGSTAPDVYLVPFAVNLSFFFALAWLLIAAWRRRPFLQHQELDWIVGLPVFLLGAISLVLVAIATLLLDTFFYWWIDKSVWQATEGFVLSFPGIG